MADASAHRTHFCCVICHISAVAPSVHCYTGIMSTAADKTPDNNASLKALIAAQRSEIEHLRLLVAKLQRHQFGCRAEPLTISQDQLHLGLGSEVKASTAPMTPTSGKPHQRRYPQRNPLPAHLPRDIEVYGVQEGCPECGGQLRHIGEDASEQLEYVPARFKVIRHVRPKLACAGCHSLVQAPAPERPIVRGIAGPGLLAHVLVSKYCDHLPLYRQHQIFAREGVDLPRSTLAEWVAESSQLLAPLVDAIRRHVLSGKTLHADDTPVPALEPGRGRTKTGRLWTYVRDERPAGSAVAPAVWFAYSPDRQGKHPQHHLAHYEGIIHADGYAGFNKLFETGKRQESACWAHLRRKFYEIHGPGQSAGGHGIELHPTILSRRDIDPGQATG